MRNRLVFILLALASFAYMSAPATGQVSAPQNQKQSIDRNAEDLSGKRVIGIEFRGNRIFSDEQLLEQFRYTKALSRAKSSAFDFIYDSQRIDTDRRLATFFMRSHGYLTAIVGEPEAEATDQGIKLIMPVEEGALYRIGKLKVSGATVFSPEEVIRFLNVEPGGIANGKEIGDGLYERLRRAYGEKGHIQYTAEPTPTYRLPDGASEGIVDFKIDIDEGTRFRIRLIEFEGDAAATEGLLRNTMLIQEGEVYNQTRFEESIERLNQLGLFEDIDKEKDVGFRTNDEERLLDITIKVKEVASP